MDSTCELLRSARKIAVVGFSQNASRPSHWIAEYLSRAGYEVFPVNPILETALGGTCYKTLESIPHEIDIVNIFRSPEHVPEVVEEAIRLHAKAVWMQEGAENPTAAQRARDAGLQVVIGRCIFRDHADCISNK